MNNFEMAQLSDQRPTFDRPGLSAPDFNKALDQYLTDGTIQMDDYLEMSNLQKEIIQAVKKSIKRIKSKQQYDTR